VGEQGFVHFTRSLPVIYLRQWLNEKPEHTNFCSKQIPPGAQFDSLSSVAVGAMATPASAARTTSQKKTSSTKAKNKDMLVELVAELKDRRGEKSVSFGLVKSPDTKEMKLHITSMISSQATAAKHNATKDAMALLVFKLNTANEALLRAVNDVEREKYTRIIEKLQRKMDKHLLEDSDEEPNYDDNTCFSSFEDRLNSATD
jgi:hypothetical protein